MSDEGLLKRATQIDDEEIQGLTEEADNYESEDYAPIPVSGDDQTRLLWISANEESAVPQVLIDRDLRVRWRNRAYRQFRETPGLDYNYRERTFDDFFSTFADGTPRAKILRTRLHQALQDPRSGYSWQGAVAGLGPNLLRFIARMSISPQFVDDSGTIRYFGVTIDEITEDYEEVLHSSFEGILKASLLKDEDTGQHVSRVNAYSKRLAEALLREKNRGEIRWIDVNEDFVSDIGRLAAFHDVGKIGTPEKILLKQGSLSEGEWATMKEHPINGALVLSSHPKSMAREIARSHHERWDGTGYPYSIAGESIPLSGRIVAVADVYDALRTRRPYKEPFSEEEAYKIIIEGAGTHFDPGIVEVFKVLREDFDRISRELADQSD